MSGRNLSLVGVWMFVGGILSLLFLMLGNVSLGLDLYAAYVLFAGLLAITAFGAVLGLVGVSIEEVEKWRTRKRP